MATAVAGSTRSGRDLGQEEPADAKRGSCTHSSTTRQSTRSTPARWYDARGTEPTTCKRNTRLTIYFGDVADVVYNTSVYFKFNYEPSWLEDPFVQEMILDVDSSRVLGNGAIDSPVLGVIAPVTLSGGVKTLILIDKVPNKVFNASNCGDNCAKWLLRIGERRNVTVNLRHIMDFGDDPLQIAVANTGATVTSMDELVPIAGRYV